jgi:hypothetical protein
MPLAKSGREKAGKATESRALRKRILSGFTRLVFRRSSSPNLIELYEHRQQVFASGFGSGLGNRQNLFPGKVAARCSYRGTGRSCVQLDFGGREFFEKAMVRCARGQESPGPEIEDEDENDDEDENYEFEI